MVPCSGIRRHGQPALPAWIPSQAPQQAGQLGTVEAPGLYPADIPGQPALHTANTGLFGENDQVSMRAHW